MNIIEKIDKYLIEANEKPNPNLGKIKALREKIKKAKEEKNFSEVAHLLAQIAALENKPKNEEADIGEEKDIASARRKGLQQKIADLENRKKRASSVEQKKSIDAEITQARNEIAKIKGTHK
jgi:neutral trehalase